MRSYFVLTIYGIVLLLTGCASGIVTIRLIAANAIAEAFEASFAALNALLLWGKPIKRYPIYALH